jgi:hydroxyacylglutathione hydrolase
MITEIYPDLFLLRDAVPDPRAQFVYVVRHAGGLVVFGTKADLSAHFDALRTLGRPTHVLLGDRHHATEHTARLAAHFGVPLSASQVEAAALKGILVGDVLPYRRGEIIPGLEAIPTPGHTRGAFSYLWHSGGKRFLFVGDTIVPVDGAWRYWVSPPNLGLMRASVQTLAALDADVILSNSFAAVPRAWLELTPPARMALFADLERQLAVPAPGRPAARGLQ